MNVCGGCIISLRITAYRCFTTVIWAYVVYYNASWRGLSVLLIPGAEAMREPEDLGWARSRDSHVFFSIYPIFINRLFSGVLQGIYFLLLWQRTRTKNSSLAEISSKKQEKVFCQFWASWCCQTFRALYLQLKRRKADVIQVVNPPVLADVILVAIPVAKTAAEEAVPILAKVVVKAPPNNSSDLFIRSWNSAGQTDLTFRIFSEQL